MGWTTLPDGTSKLDVRPFLGQMEDQLPHGTAGMRQARILATLRRWQSDAMLDRPSRALARALAMECDALETAALWLARRPHR